MVLQKLKEYSSSTEKVNNLINLEMMKSIYCTMQENFETPEGKNEPFLLKSIEETNNSLNKAYHSLIDESIAEETDKYNTKEVLALTIQVLKEISGYDSVEDIVSVSKLEEFNKKISEFYEG